MRNYIITGDLPTKDLLENLRSLKKEYEEEKAQLIAEGAYGKISFIKCKLDGKIYALKEYKMGVDER